MELLSHVCGTKCYIGWLFFMVKVESEVNNDGAERWSKTQSFLHMSQNW